MTAQSMSIAPDGIITVYLNDGSTAVRLTPDQASELGATLMQVGANARDIRDTAEAARRIDERLADKRASEILRELSES